MTCPACGSEQASVDFGERGRVFTCLACENQWRPQPDAAPVQLALVAPVAPAKTQSVTPIQHLAPAGILQQARAELKRLNGEIKRLEQLKKQRDEIKRLLAAAKTKQPRAVVRALRQQG